VAAYRHSASAVQRAKKRSATGAAAYRTGTRLVDVRTGVEYDYTRRRGVAAAYLIVPGASRIDAVDRQSLWAAVELKHTRGDAVPAREFVTALPFELDPVDRLALALRYGRHVSDTYGVAVDVAVHLPSVKPGHDQRNHHVHFLMTACSVRASADGLLICGKKVEALDPIASRRRGGVPVEEAERATWAAMCNAALAAAGRADVVVDHRSYERQGVDQIPQVHLGPAAHDQLLRLQAGAENVVLLDRTRRYFEIETVREHVRAAKHWEAEVMRLEADVIEMPPTTTRPDEPVQGPSAVIVAIRPAAAEPPPAPTTAAVLAQVARLWTSLDRPQGLHDERRDSWRILRAMDRNNWQPDTPALRALLDAHPALRRQWADEITEREPEIAVAERERQRSIKREAARAFMAPVPSPRPQSRAAPAPEPLHTPPSLPVPVKPAVRVSDLDAAIADAEARLAEIEERERACGQAAEAYRRAQAALQAAQAGLWARIRTWVGAGAGAAEIEALAALKKAEQSAKSAGVGIVFGKAVVPATAGERIELKKQLVALHDERGGLIAADAATARRASAAVDQVVDLVNRAYKIVPVSQRSGWPALRGLDAAGGTEQLRERLVGDPGLAIALAHDLGQRLTEIELLESVAHGPSQGLIAVIATGPVQAWPEHWTAYFSGCEHRGQITPEELERAAEALELMPAGHIERDELLRMLAHDPAPGM
jgi:hypothetical protein